MSTRTAGIEAQRPGISWSAAWVAAILLALVFAVSMFATNRAGAPIERPRTTEFVIGDQLVGGPSAVGRTAVRTGPREPIVVNGSICHQCR